MKRLDVSVKILDDRAVLPSFATDGAAGFDFVSIENVEISEGKTVMVRTGLAFAVPLGFELQVRARSGMASKGIIVTNGPGTVDSDYRGEVKVLLTNVSHKGAFVIKHGDRIAQGVINQLPWVCLVKRDELSETERGSGGFGSTGK